MAAEARFSGMALLKAEEASRDLGNCTRRPAANAA